MTKKDSKEVATVTEGALPAYLQDYDGPTGAEGIDAQDVEIPRIKLAQSSSPEVKAGTVPEGSFFLNVSGQVLAEPGKPLNVVIVASNKEFILWKDQQFEGGGIFARARRVEVALEDGGIEVKYAWDKPNQTFKNKIKGILDVEWNTLQFVEDNLMDKFGSSNVADSESHPAATAHFNYVVYLPDSGIVAALSLSNSAHKRGRKFNALLTMPNAAPVAARQYALTSDDCTNPAGQIYKNYVFTPNGFITQEQFAITDKLHNDFGVKGFAVDQSRADVDAGTANSGGKF